MDFKTGNLGRRAGVGFLLCLFLLGAVACTSGQPADQTKAQQSGPEQPQVQKVKVGTLLSLELNLPVWVGLSQGYYKEANLDVELSYLGGGVAVRDATASKDIDIGLIDMYSPVASRAAGIPLTIIGDWYDAELWVFMVSTRLKDQIKSVKDLRGRVILTSPPGSVAWAMARAVAAKEGLDPDTDVKFLVLPDFSAETWINLLEKGEADAAVTWEPFRTILSRRNVAETLLSMREPAMVEKYLGGSVTSMSAIAHADVIAQKPDIMRTFAQATNRGIDFIKQHSAEELGKIVAPYMEVQPDFATEAVRGSLDAFVGDLSISRGNYERRVKFFADAQLIKQAVGYDQTVDATFAGTTE